jgi:hypothetical protein
LELLHHAHNLDLKRRQITAKQYEART